MGISCDIQDIFPSSGVDFYITATSELTSAGCHLTHLASDLGWMCQKVRLYCTFVSGLCHSVLFWLRWGKKTFTGKRLSQVSMYVVFLPLPVLGTVNDATVGSFIVSNRLVAGSIMVRRMKLILVLSLPLRVYYLVRCTYNALGGVIMTSFNIVHDYTFGFTSCFWKDLQDLMLLDGMCIPFQYITDLIVSLRHEWLGCWR